MEQRCISCGERAGPLVSFYDPENPEKKNLRFDLVASNSIYLEVEQIVINSRYGLFCNIVKYMLLALLYVFYI